MQRVKVENHQRRATASRTGNVTRGQTRQWREELKALRLLRTLESLVCAVQDVGHISRSNDVAGEVS